MIAVGEWRLVDQMSRSVSGRVRRRTAHHSIGRLADWLPLTVTVAALAVAVISIRRADPLAPLALAHSSDWPTDRAD
jgi:hypothetical protein